MLVLELCPGGDLKQHMSRCGRLAPEVAAFVAAQVQRYLVITPNVT